MVHWTLPRDSARSGVDDSLMPSQEKEGKAVLWCECLWLNVLRAYAAQIARVLGDDIQFDVAVQGDEAGIRSRGRVVSVALDDGTGQY